MNNVTGTFVLTLHSHIPYVVSHGKWPHGTDWLSEAAAETYLPFLRMLRELESEGIQPKITIGISPILAEQLADPVFHDELSSYLVMKASAAEDDLAFFTKSGMNHMADLARNWIDFYTVSREEFENFYNRDMISGFREYLKKGTLDIITCGATHGYFPLLGTEEAINLQVKAAIETHKKHFEEYPTGIWMPECAYRPGYTWRRPVENGYENEPYLRKGVEEFLAEHNIQYTFIDSHLLKGGKAIGAYADRFKGLRMLVQQMKKEHTFEETKDLSPYRLFNLQSERHSERSVALFTRDPKSGLQVWSGEWGYPGDGQYMDFHKKRFPGGLRYWRVTGADCGLGDKEVYNPEEVEKRLEENASHFVSLIHEVLNENYKATGTPGVLASPFDTELFGHWWFEGVKFIKKVYRNLSKSDQITCTTARETMSLYPPETTISIPEGSWGEGGFHYIWLNEHNEWTWRDLYQDEIQAQELVAKARESKSEDFRELVTQILRELMLAHASDWQFLISTFSARDYAEMRLANHHTAFQRLVKAAERFMENGTLSQEDRFLLDEIYERDHPFKHLNFEWYTDLIDR